MSAPAVDAAPGRPSIAGAEFAPPAPPEQRAAIAATLGVTPPKSLEAFLAQSDGAAFMEPGHTFTAHFPGGPVTAILQWLHGAAEIVAQTGIWRAPSPWLGAPALPRPMLVIGSAVDDLDRGVLLVDLREEAVVPGAVVYRRLGFDPSLADAGLRDGFGYVAPDLDLFLVALAG